jgi:hypothetical protein
VARLLERAVHILVPTLIIRIAPIVATYGVERLIKANKCVILQSVILPNVSGVAPTTAVGLIGWNWSLVIPRTLGFCRRRCH